MTFVRLLGFRHCVPPHAGAAYPSGDSMESSGTPIARQRCGREAAIISLYSFIRRTYASTFSRWSGVKNGQRVRSSARRGSAGIGEGGEDG